jgi:hypothetical protein
MLRGRAKKVGEGRGYVGIALDEVAIESSETEELSKLF